ncbi:MAG: M4 family metallopeptidase [Planctomycetota bacterium]|nr:MAG: M4 family metallopeptidase [Planctomycetota bacterium]
MKSILESRWRILCVGLGVLVLVLAGCDLLGIPTSESIPPSGSESESGSPSDSESEPDSPLDSASEPIPPSNAESVAGQQNLDRLRSASLRSPELRVAGGVPAFLTVDVPVSPELADNPIEAALRYLQDYKELYRMHDPNQQLFLNRVRGIVDEAHVFFYQKHNEVQVFAAELAVHIVDGHIVMTSGHYLPVIQVSSEPMLKATDAQAIALAGVPGTQTTLMGVPKLMYYDESLIAGGRSDTHLSWRINVRGYRVSDGAGTSWMVFVDAHDGSLLAHYDELVTDAPDKSIHIRTANNAWVGNCGWPTADWWFDEDGDIGYPGAAQDPFLDGLKAANGSQQVYDFFFDNFHRHSWDGYDFFDEHHVAIIVHVGTNWENAGYDPACEQLVFGDGYVTLDALAHEWTHAIDDHEAKLEYEYQSGALEENFADVFACFVDSGDWLIGEDRPGGPSRSLADPPQYVQPDHMDHEYYTLADDDYGGAHTNSGVPNKAAYLIIEGGNHGGYIIKGIGRDKAMQLYYKVLTNGVTSNANFDDMRDLMVQFAFQFGGQWGFTGSDICDVRNAYAAVGINVGGADSDCDMLPDSSESDDDNDGILDADDNCPHIPNIFQEDTDDDGIGNFCDPDIDDDGVPNSEDNCPWVENTGQDDSDGDGFGDVCDPDDYDNDGVENEDDNCPHHPNPDQADSDGDGVGNVCDNCPDVPNPDQTDCDGNGVGRACDFGKEFIYQDDCNIPRTYHPWVHPMDLVTLPGCDDCPISQLQQYLVRVNVALPYAIPVRLVDDRGHVVARGMASREQTIEFAPEAGFFDNSFQGTQFFLEMPATELGPSADMPFEIDVHVEFELYLPPATTGTTSGNQSTDTPVIYGPATRR